MELGYVFVSTWRGRIENVEKRVAPTYRGFNRFNNGSIIETRTTRKASKSAHELRNPIRGRVSVIIRDE